MDQGAMGPGAMGNLPPLTEDRGPTFLKVNWIGVGFGVLFVGARIITRIRVMRKLSLDDYLMLVSLTFGIVSAGLNTVAVGAGFGKHIMALRPDQLMKAIKYQYIIQPFAYLGLVFGRVSFAVSLIVIIGVTKPRRYLLYALIIGQFVLNLTWVGIQLGQCDPPQKYWNRALPGTCLDPRVQIDAGYVTQSFNILTDFILAVLPSYVVSNLNMRLGTKVGIIFLMGLGIFNMAAAIVTVVEISNVGGGRDITYDFVTLDIWGLVQTYLAICIASIPFIRPLFRNFKSPHFLSWAFYSSIFHRYSRKSQSSGSPQEKKERSTLPSSQHSRFQLPRVRRDRFVTTTLKNVGVEDEANLMERGEKLRHPEDVRTTSQGSATETLSDTRFSAEVTRSHLVLT